MVVLVGLLLPLVGSMTSHPYDTLLGCRIILHTRAIDRRPVLLGDLQPMHGHEHPQMDYTTHTLV